MPKAAARGRIVNGVKEPRLGSRIGNSAYEPFLAHQEAPARSRPDAPNDKLYVDPDLPDWLPDVTLMDLRLGRRHLDIRFRREGGKTVWDVLRGDAKRVAYRSSVEAHKVHTGT